MDSIHIYGPAPAGPAFSRFVASVWGDCEGSFGGVEQLGETETLMMWIKHGFPMKIVRFGFCSHCLIGLLVFQ